MVSQSIYLAMVTLNQQSEGLVAPSKLYGHLATGTPIGIISPENSYLRNLIEDESCGRWFNNGNSKELADWIQELIKEPEIANNLGKASRALIEKTASEEIICKKYLDIIQKNLHPTKIL